MLKGHKNGGFRGWKSMCSQNILTLLEEFKADNRWKTHHAWAGGGMDWEIGIHTHTHTYTHIYIYIYIYITVYKIDN